MLPNDDSDSFKNKIPLLYSKNTLCFDKMFCKNDQLVSGNLIIFDSYDDGKWQAWLLTEKRSSKQHAKLPKQQVDGKQMWSKQSWQETTSTGVLKHLPNIWDIRAIVENGRGELSCVGPNGRNNNLPLSLSEITASDNVFTAPVRERGDSSRHVKIRLRL